MMHFIANVKLSSLCLHLILFIILLLPQFDCIASKPGEHVISYRRNSSHPHHRSVYTVTAPHTVHRDDVSFASHNKFNDKDEQREHQSRDENKQMPLEVGSKDRRSAKRRRDAYNANNRLRIPYISEHPEDVTVQKHSPTTLNCKADGNPPPVIEWFKDGEKVKHTGNRMVLPSGSLFFLHVIQNKDTGVYWCTANNHLGSVASRKATLSLPGKHTRINKASSSTATPISLDSLSSSTTITIDSGDPDDADESNVDENDADSNLFNGIPSSPGQLYPPAPLNPSQATKSSGKSSSSHANDLSHHHHPNHYQRDPLKEPWFIIVATLTVMFILSSGVLIFLMRARSSSSASNKTPVVQHINVSMLPNDLGANNINGNKIASSIVHDSVWIDHSWFNTTNSGNNGNQSNLTNAMATSLATMFGSNSRLPSSSSKFIREMTAANGGGGAGGAGGTGSSTLEDTYSEIESNDYAVVADVQNLSTFKSRNVNNGHSSSGNLICNSSINNNGVSVPASHRSNSPGPYATTNLINITPNALYRVSNDITNCKSYHRPLNPLVDHISSFTQLQSTAPPPNDHHSNGNGSSNGLRKCNQQQQNASPYHKLKS